MSEIMQTKAVLRSLRVAPRKVRLLIDLIRGMKVDKAINQLQFSKKDAAKSVLKLLNSAIANAQNNHKMKRDTLVIKTAFVDGGPTLHRWIPRAMGRATPIRKRTSHITIVLEGEVDEKEVKKTKASAEKMKEVEKVGKKLEEIKEKNTKKDVKDEKSKAKNPPSPKATEGQEKTKKIKK